MKVKELAKEGENQLFNLPDKTFLPKKFTTGKTV
jgi:hypothetical protein